MPSIDVAVESKEGVPGVSYKSHISGIGWESTFTSNGSISGTTGQSRRLEALRVSLPNSEDLGIEYRSHVQNEGWQGWVSNGEPSLARRERAFRLKPSSLSWRVTGQLLMTCIIAFMLLISAGLDGRQMGRLREPPVGLMPLKQYRSLL